VAGYFVGKPAAIESAQEQKVAASDSNRGTSSKPPRDLALIVANRSIAELPDEIAGLVDALLTTAVDDPLAAFLSLAEIEDPTLRTEVALELVGKLSGDQIHALVSHLAGMDEDSDELDDLFDSPMIPMAMFDRWAQLDPDGIEEFALEPFNLSGDDSLEVALIMRVFPLAMLVRTDPERAYEVAGKLRSNPEFKKIEESMGGGRGSMIDMFFGFGLGMSDPITAIRTLRERGMSPEQIPEADEIFEMAGMRSGEVLEEIRQYPEGEGRDKMELELYREWAGHDVASALASASDLPEGDHRQRVLFDILRSAARHDPQAAIQNLELTSEGEQRERTTYEIVRGWARQDPVEAMRWAQGVLAEDRFVEQFESVSSSIPTEEGAEFVEGMTAEQRASFFERDQSINDDHFVMRMAMQDPAGTFEWLSEQGGVNALNGSVFASAAIFGGGGESATAVADSLPEDLEWAQNYRTQVARLGSISGDRSVIDWARGQSPDVHGIAVGAWASTEPLAAAEYAFAQGDSTLVSSTVTEWSIADPAEAYRWIVETYDGEPDAVANVLAESNLTSNWGRQDPGAAAIALSGFPDASGAPHMEGIIRSWAVNEPSRASEFIAENLNDEGPMRDAAIGSLVNVIAGESPLEARAWAESITGEEARARALEALEQQEN